MTTLIYKYKLEVCPKQTIKMPAEAKLLTVQTQNDILCIWAIVDPEKPLEDYTFHVIGTGHVSQENLDDTGNFAYISTAQMASGALVWHIFLERR